MLVSFKVKNFLSFKDETTFSLKAASISEHGDENTFRSSVNELKLLRGAALYGANASGKSNLFRAINFVTRFVRSSAKDFQVKEPIPISTFKLSTQTDKEPSTFEIEFILNDTKYRYEFTVDAEIVHHEALHIQKKIKEYKVFERIKSHITIEEKYSDANKIKPLTRSNALFLSTAAMLNIQWASEVIGGFEKFRFLGDNLPPTLQFQNDQTANMLDDPKFHHQLLKLFKAGDLGFDNIVSELISLKPEESSRAFSDSSKKFFFDNKVRIVSTLHNRLDEHGNTANQVAFDLNEESAGTKKYYFLAGPIVEALYFGNVLIVDEFTSRLHPLLAEQIIKLFHSNTINRNNAQLIIVTHNTYLLNEDLYRRDQIFIVRKDDRYSSKITNLYNAKVRKDATFEKRYLHDRELGGMPNWDLNKDTFWSE